MLYHHSYYGVSPLPLPNVISFTTTISTTSASLYHSCILDHCFFGLPLFVWTTTTLWIATIFLDYRCIYVSSKAVCDPNFRFFSWPTSTKTLGLACLQKILELYNICSDYTICDIVFKGSYQPVRYCHDRNEI